MVQTKKIDDRVEIIFEARECVVAAFYDSLAAGSVVRHRTVIQHFISRLLQQRIKSGASSGSICMTLDRKYGVTLAHIAARCKGFSF